MASIKVTVWTSASVVLLVIVMYFVYVRTSAGLFSGTYRTQSEKPPPPAASLPLSYPEYETVSSPGDAMTQSETPPQTTASPNLSYSENETVSSIGDAPSTNLTFRSYLLTVNIEQQSTAAMHGYSDLVALGGFLNLSAVELYVHSTNLVGVPAMKEEGSNPGVMTLSTLYDLEDLRAKVESCYTNKNLTMSSFEGFVETASRQIIYVYILHSLRKYRSKFYDQKKIVETVTDDAKLKQALIRLNKWTAYVSEKSKLPLASFKTSRVFLIDARPKVALRLATVKEVLGSAVREEASKNGAVTVLFDNWRAIHTKPDTTYFYYVPDFHKSCVGFDLIDHSQKVIEASQAFSMHLKDSSNHSKIGVHIRGERLLLKYKQNFVGCLKRLNDTVQNITRNLSNPQVRLIHDLTKYGTQSCWGDCSKYRSKYLSELKKLEFPVLNFDPTDYPSFPRNPAFAAFVEREYLSKMDVLVTVGHGGFQNTIVGRFLKHTKKEQLYRICNEWLN